MILLITCYITNKQIENDASRENEKYILPIDMKFKGKKRKINCILNLKF